MKKINEKGMVSFGQAFKDFWLGYIDFRGRSTRAGYWWAQLALCLIYAVVMLIMMITMVVSDSISALSIFGIMLLGLFTLAILVPSLALSVRRLRDTGIQSKTILGLYLVFFALSYTMAMLSYSSIISSVINQFSYGTHETMPMMMNYVSSPLLTFITILISLFISVCTVLPTGMFATNSKNPVLKALFYTKKA